MARTQQVQQVQQEVQPLLVGAHEVGEAIGVGYPKVLELARDRRIPSIRLGHRTLRFDLGEVLAALGRAATPMVPTTPGLDIKA